MTINRYKVYTRDVTYDPWNLTGSWAVATNPMQARDILLANLGYNPEERKSVRTKFDERFELAVLKNHAIEFPGTYHEWIEAVTRNVFDEYQLCFLVPEAKRHVRLASPPPTREELRAARKRQQKALRTPFLSKLEWVFANHPTVWKFFGIAVVAVAVGVFLYFTWLILLVFFGLIFALIMMVAMVLNMFR